jgi:hypothetical protein
MAQVLVAEILRPLWTHTRFLSKHPIPDLYGAQKYQEKGPLLVRSIFCPDQLRTGRCAISVITAGYALRGSWHGNCYRGS